MLVFRGVDQEERTGIDVVDVSQIDLTYASLTSTFAVGENAALLIEVVVVLLEYHSIDVALVLNSVVVFYALFD